MDGFMDFKIQDLKVLVLGPSNPRKLFVFPLLFIQIQSRDLLPREEHKQKVKNMIEELREPDESCRHSQSHDVLYPSREVKHMHTVELC